MAFPIEIVVCPTVREADGLAMSSRNVRLDPDSRGRAPVIKQALDVAEAMIASGERDASVIEAAARVRLAEAGIEAEYCDVVSPIDLAPVRTIDGTVLIAIAARVGGVRLIDNALVVSSNAAE